MEQKFSEILQQNTYKEVVDPSLENWQKWMNYRWKIVRRITQKIQRPLEMSIMNISEELIDVKQDKLVLEYTKITTKFDKYRGNPAFWRNPITLNDPCSKDRQSEYCAVETKSQQNILPTIEHVATPDLIQQEKHTLPRDRHLYKLWQTSKYREEKLKKVSTKIAQIVPHKPHCENLVIIGKNIGGNVELRDNIGENGEDQLSSKEPSESSHPNSINSEYFYRLALKINDTLITDNSPKNQEKILLLFEYDFPDNPYQIKYLKLTNNGRVALRISFKQLPEFKLFKEYTVDYSQKYAFNFDMNEHLIIPNQTIEIPVCFTTFQPGFYKETWKISTRPTFWNCQIVVTFLSYVSLKITQSKIVEIQTFIDNETRDRVVNEVINDLINFVDVSTDTDVPECEVNDAHQS